MVPPTLFFRVGQGVVSRNAVSIFGEIFGIGGFPRVFHCFVWFWLRLFCLFVAYLCCFQRVVLMFWGGIFVCACVLVFLLQKKWTTHGQTSQNIFYPNSNFLGSGRVWFPQMRFRVSVNSLVCLTFPCDFHCFVGFGVGCFVFVLFCLLSLCSLFLCIGGIGFVLNVFCCFSFDNNENTRNNKINTKLTPTRCFRVRQGVVSRNAVSSLGEIFVSLVHPVLFIVLICFWLSCLFVGVFCFPSCMFPNVLGVLALF